MYAKVAHKRIVHIITSTILVHVEKGKIVTSQKDVGQIGQTVLKHYSLLYYSTQYIGSYHWQVPVSISSSTNPRESVASTLLDQTSCTVTVNGVKPDQWIKVCSPLATI